MNPEGSLFQQILGSDVLICSNDAGGANILSSLISRLAIKPKYLLSGPAINIFENKLGQISLMKHAEGLKGIDLVLSGTSKNSNLEFDLMSFAESNGIRVIAVLDHWVNYRERFIRDKKQIPIREIVTSDELANEIAIAKFPEARIYQIPNYYLSDISNEYNSILANKMLSSDYYEYLYLGEPIQEDYDNYTYQEVDAIRYFIETVRIKHKIIPKILFRPHPSQTGHSFHSVVHSVYPEGVISENQSLAQAFAYSNYVVGCNTMALTIAASFGKKSVFNSSASCYFNSTSRKYP